MKQTAVEWFFNELKRMNYFIGNDMYEAYKQAKELEKQDIIDAHVSGYDCSGENGEDYYNAIYDKTNG
jgi:hypothetical protein